MVGMFLYLGGVWTSSHIHMPPVYSYALICSYAPRGVHTPHMPPILLCLCVFWRLCMLWGVVMGSPLCCDILPYITPVWGCLPFIYTPTLSCWFPVHQYVSGISVCYVGISLLLKGLGVFPHQLGHRGGIST